MVTIAHGRDSALTQSPVPARPADILPPRQGRIDKGDPGPPAPPKTHNGAGFQLRAVGLDALHNLRCGSSKILSLPNGAINQSFYRDGSHKAPHFTVKE